MLRNVALLCLIIAGLLALRASAILFWPRFRDRMDRAADQYAHRLKDLFRPMTAARPIALAQYVGTIVLALLIYLATGNPVFSAAIPTGCFLLPGIIFAR